MMLCCSGTTSDDRSYDFSRRDLDDTYVGLLRKASTSATFGVDGFDTILEDGDDGMVPAEIAHRAFAVLHTFDRRHGGLELSPRPSVGQPSRGGTCWST
jgi:hypothetical protein